MFRESSFQPDNYTALNRQIDQWYTKLAVSEARMEQMLELKAEILAQLTKSACYLMTGLNGNNDEHQDWDLLIYGSVTNGLC